MRAHVGTLPLGLLHDTIMCFVDFASVFDSVYRGYLWRITSAVEAYHHITVRASAGDSLSFEMRSVVRQGCELSPTDFKHMIDWVLGQTLQGYSGVQVSTNTHVSDLGYADDIVLLNNSYREMQGLQQLACALALRKPR